MGVLDESATSEKKTRTVKDEGIMGVHDTPENIRSKSSFAEVYKIDSVSIMQRSFN